MVGDGIGDPAVMGRAVVANRAPVRCHRRRCVNPRKDSLPRLFSITPPAVSLHIRFPRSNMFTQKLGSEIRRAYRVSISLPC